MKDASDTPAARCGVLLELGANRFKPYRVQPLTSADRVKLRAAGVKWADEPAPTPTAVAPQPKPETIARLCVVVPNIAKARDEVLALGSAPAPGALASIAAKSGVDEQALRFAVARQRERDKKSSKAGRVRYVVTAAELAARGAAK